jgi:hypothetical protein
MSPHPRLTIDRLADKVSWEGGVIGALEFGVRSDDIADPEAASLWRRLEELYGQLRPAMWQMERMLRESARQP